MNAVTPATRPPDERGHARNAVTPPAGAFDCHTHVFGPFERFPLAATRAYTPGPASVARLRAHLSGLGIERVVLVAPSPYGTDNSRLVAALAELGPRAVGVAVTPPDATADQLRELDRAGVRGFRVNLHSARNAEMPDQVLRRAREALRRSADQAGRHGWHLQVFAATDLLLGTAPTLAALPVPVVIDHFGLVAEPGPDLDALCELVREPHVWIKLSAPERCTPTPDAPPFTEVATALLHAAPDRAVWASDWPHTDGRNRTDPRRPEPFRPVDDHAALARLRRWCAAEHLYHAVLHHNPRRLYTR